VVDARHEDERGRVDDRERHRRQAEQEGERDERPDEVAGRHERDRAVSERLPAPQIRPDREPREESRAAGQRRTEPAGRPALVRLSSVGG
jgi:hypothetical protein